jgi:hypothetical protein
MRNTPFIWVILAGVLALVPVNSSSAVVIDQMDSGDFAYRYDFDDGLRPDQSDFDENGTNDFTWFNNASPIGTATVAGGILTMETTTAGGGNWFQGTTANEAWHVLAPTIEQGYTIEIRAKIFDTAFSRPLSVMASPAGTADHAYLSVNEHGQVWGIDGTILGDASSNMDAFHTFRVAQEPGASTYSVWRDGRLLAEALPSGASHNADRFLFGDVSGSHGGKAEVDYFRFTAGAYAPEIGSHPDLYAWYKADAGVKDASGNVPDHMTEDVVLWENQAPSGSARDLNVTSDAGSRWPKYDQSATVVGTPAVHFDTNDDIYAFPKEVGTGAQLWGTLSQPNTISLVLRTETADGGTPVYGVASAGIQYLQSGGNDDDRGQWVLGSKATGLTETILPTAEIVTSEFQIHTLIFDGEDSKHYIDGELVGTGNAGTASLSGLLLGAFQTGTYGNWTGDIAEILVYSAVLSDLDRASVESYLYQKHFVPEPSAFALTVLGLGILLLRRRRHG